ncbi:MAG: hypothetical protein O3B13_10160 [Planctomycetota bacterium]|nr:hypothetical protein [Planctomycetota bacterium]
MSPAISPRPARNRSGAVSGPVVVVVMVAFGAIATGALWVYWYYHSAPFIPLQRAISAEFPRSSPRVDGGRRRMHKGTPSEIWIIMRVEFDVESDEVASAAAVQRVKELAHEHLTPGDYDLLHVRLYRGDPEQFLHKRDVDIPLGDVDSEAAAA